MAQYRVKNIITLRIRYTPPLADGTLGADAGKVLVAGDLFDSDQRSEVSGVPWLRITRIFKADDGRELLPPADKSWWCNGSGLYVTLISAPPLPVEPSVFITHEFNDVLTIGGKQYKAIFTISNVEYKPVP